MKKYALMSAFVFAFSNFALAQLTLKKMESNGKISLPIGALIEIKLPTKTSRLDCNCFQSFTGYLRNVEGDTATLELTETNRETVDDNKAAIREKNIFIESKDSVLMRVPLTNVLVINRLSEGNVGFQKLGGVIATFSVLNNLFVAPYVGGELGASMRNIGYGGMAFGLLTALLPTKKIYFFEQPKKNKRKKTLWKLGN